MALEDSDSDISVTARVDADGATVRPPRVVTAHTADGLREADFTGHDRAHRIDRHYIRSNREDRARNIGARFVVQMECIRAGETFSLDRLVAWLKPLGDDERPEGQT